MTTQFLAGGILAAALALFVPATLMPLIAQDKAQDKAPDKATDKATGPAAAAPAKEASAQPKIGPAKEAKIRELMEVLGTKNLGQQFLKASMDQLRANASEAASKDARVQQFLDLFIERFQKHFDLNAVTETMVPIYDKHLSGEDLNGLLAFYKTPLGQRTLKVMPEIMRESQAAGFALGQKAGQETMVDIQTEHPELMPGARESQPQPQPKPQAKPLAKPEAKPTVKPQLKP